MERRVLMNLLEERLLNLSGRVIHGWDSAEWLARIYTKRTSMGWRRGYN